MGIDLDPMLRTPLGGEISKKPGAFMVRAPGRVNLIGEHTDYNGLPVLPMAIDREVAILAAPIDDPVVRIANVDPSFEPREFHLGAEISPFPQGDWGNYVKAAAQALIDWSDARINGFQGLVWGNIPAGAGLSSSSAMVVASALALMQANGLQMPKSELAELLARGERYVGTQGGGMDQTVSLMAEEGRGLKIDFFPIRAQPLPLPLKHSVIVCNTLVSAWKAGLARNAYNTRVVECRIGLALLKQALGNEQLAEARLLGDLMNKSAVPRSRIMNAVEALPERLLKVGSVSEALLLSPKQAEEMLRQHDGCLLTMPDDGFRIRSRCRHVFTEAARVERTALASTAQEFGMLMDESHESCANDYEISCPELDSLVRICRQAGALGARLTGAGFGGCVIALVPDDLVGKFIETVTYRYYHSYFPSHRPDLTLPMDLSDAIFACKPSAGASVRML